MPRPALTLLLALLLALTVSAGCFKSPASASHDFVSSTKYTKVFVEIDYVQGQDPDSGAVALLKKRMEERLSKPDGVEVRQTAFQSSQTTYSVDDIRRLEQAQRDHRASGSTVVLYVLYLNGHSNEDNDDGMVLGVHYGQSSIAIFKESIESTGLLGLSYGTDDVEEAVLVHEFGHTIGLVNNGLAMVRDHEDDAHPKHSTNKNSVMYWAIDNTAGLKGLTGSIPDNFDSDDINDIRNAGGK